MCSFLRIAFRRTYAALNVKLCIWWRTDSGKICLRRLNIIDLSGVESFRDTLYADVWPFIHLGAILAFLILLRDRILCRLYMLLLLLSEACQFSSYWNPFLFIDFAWFVLVFIYLQFFFFLIILLFFLSIFFLVLVLFLLILLFLLFIAILIIRNICWLCFFYNCCFSFRCLGKGDCLRASPQCCKGKKSLCVLLLLLCFSTLLLIIMSMLPTCFKVLWLSILLSSDLFSVLIISDFFDVSDESVKRSTCRIHVLLDRDLQERKYHQYNRKYLHTMQLKRAIEEGFTPPWKRRNVKLQIVVRQPERLPSLSPNPSLYQPPTMAPRVHLSALKLNFPITRT